MFRIALSLVIVSALLTAGSQVAAAQTKTPPAAAKPAAAMVVNINTASATEIATLPGIGDKTAARIVEYRQKNGPFKKVEEILETSRSGPYSLPVFDLVSPSSVSRSRGKSQQISRWLASGGRSGGRTYRPMPLETDPQPCHARRKIASAGVAWRVR